MQEPLRKALKKPDFREEFWSDYKNNDFLFIARKYCKYRALEDLKWKIKKVSKVEFEGNIKFYSVATE